MDYTIYKCSLGIALVLMLFFATYFLLAKTPEKPIFGNYVRSRRLMGCALLVLAANYSVHLFDDTHSEDIGAYIRWMSILTWWAVIYGVSCGLWTFLPDEYVFLWILSSIPFYIYIYCSYINYLLFYEQVESILEKATPEEISSEMPEASGFLSLSYFTKIFAEKEGASPSKWRKQN